MTRIALPYYIPREWGPTTAENIQKNFERLYRGTPGFGGTQNALVAPVSFSDLQEMTSSRVLGRRSAGTGVIEELTLSQVLDLIGSAAQGDILYRGASGWARLPAGLSGRFLQTSGTGANPAWGTPTGAASPAAAACHFEYWMHGGIAVGQNVTDGTLTGGASQRPSPPFADAQYWQVQVTNASGSTATFAGNTGTAAPIDLIWDFDISMVMRTTDDLASIRYLLGVSVNNENVDSPAAAGVWFRYSTAVPDGGWVGIAHDGTTLSSPTATVAAIAVSTRYVLRIRKVSSNVFFSVNGGAEVTLSSNVPVTTVPNCNFRARLTNLANIASAREFYMSRVWCDYAT